MFFEILKIKKNLIIYFSFHFNLTRGLVFNSILPVRLSFLLPVDCVLLLFVGQIKLFICCWSLNGVLVDIISFVPMEFNDDVELLRLPGP